MNTTINGHPVKVLERYTASNDGTECIEVIRIRGTGTDWPIGTDVLVLFPEDSIHGRVVAVVQMSTGTALLIYCCSNSSARPSADYTLGS